ncbi:hypothetical protein BKA70DRAFT_1097245 [Coprinopsis sp. MPI-PUGE-AT-0042]|nr:hypothetical protein BKA70DRAFT_1097245 [Coprinopsis sp. MPI-PUGE-AT-0042]
MSSSSRPLNNPRDDASSFYNPGERPSYDQLGNNGRPSAGYNRGSYFNMGREEPVKGGKDEQDDEEAWDVYADFNNSGPKYSSNIPIGPTTSNGYQQLTTPKSALPPSVDEEGGNKVEMVTVPAMGAEWSKHELRGMTKTARKQDKAERRREFWKSWNRGERGLCGKYFTRRVFVFFLFGVIVAIGVVLAFTIPRVPKIIFVSATPLAAATGKWEKAVEVGFSRAPANFSFPAFAALQLDTTSNFLPLHFKSLKAEVFDLDSGRSVGTGDLGERKIPAKAFPRILLPLNMTYNAINDSDVTWNNWYNGCKNRQLFTDGKRPPVKFRVVFDMDILGLPNHPKASTQVTDADCPIELSLNSA